jgi:trafficking protein particle complex subunit 11
MDAYPQDYVAHNYPLILLSGLRLPTEDPPPRTGLVDGPLVVGHLPLVTDERKDLLLQGFLSLQGSVSGRAAPASRSKNGSIGYRFKVAGRVCFLASPFTEF